VVAPSVNLLALLRPEAVSVHFHGRIWALTPRTAAEWIGAVALDLKNLTGVFPGQIQDEDIQEMFDIGLREPDVEQAWFTCAQEVLGAAGGRDWWWTWNLTRLALGSWIYVNGGLMLAGVQAHNTLLPDWLDAAYVLISRGRDEPGQTKLDLELNMRPRGVKVKQNPAQTRAMMEAFAAD
jgi:hypothetical protein